MDEQEAKIWLDGFYTGIEAFGETWEEFVDLHCSTYNNFDVIPSCSYCYDTGVNYITPEMCSPGKYSNSVAKCRRCNGEYGPDYEEYLWNLKILPSAT